MNCINKNHPEFKSLVNATNQNPTILASYVNMWMERVDSTRFPNSNEISTFIKEVTGNTLYYSLDAMKQIGMLYNMNNNGFMPPMVNPDAVRQTIIRRGITNLEVGKAKSGSYYLKYNNRFINPFAQYQVESKDTQGINKELNDKLTNWALIHGIKIETIEEMKARFNSENGNILDSAVGVADFLNKLIAIDPKKEKVDTLAEEISHFATSILSEDASVKRAMDNIENTEIYKQVKEQYKNVYTTEEQFKKEAVDKLLAAAIVDEFQKTDENKGIISYLQAIFDKFWKWVNTNLKNTEAGNEIKESLYPLVQRILGNEKLGNVENIDSEQETFYQLNEDSEGLKEESADPDFKSEVQVAKEFLQNNLEVLYKRLDALTRQSGVKKQSTIDRLQNKIIILKSEINGNRLRQGILGMIDLATNDLEATDKVLQKQLDARETNGNVLDTVRNFNNMYETLFLQFQQDMDYYDFNPKLKEEMNSLINQVITLIGQVGRKHDVLLRIETLRILRKANTDENGNKIDKDFDEKAIFEATKEDISAWRLQVGNFKNAKSPLVRSVFKLIHNSNNKVKRKTIEVAQELAAAQQAMEASGIKQKDLVELDSQGRPTQYLIRERNWAPYNEAKGKMQEELTKTLGFDSWQQVLEANKKEELKGEKLTIYKNTLASFRKQFPLEAVRDSKGKFLYNQPKELNPRFAEIMSNPFAKQYYDLLVKHKREAINKLPLKYRKEANAYLLPGIRGQFIEKLFRKDVSFMENIKDVAFESLFRDQDDTEFGDEQTTLNNKVIPIFFTNRFRGDKAKTLSTDLTRSFTIFAEMAESFREKNKLAGEISSIQAQLGKRNEGEAVGSNEYKAVSLLLNTSVYGLEKKDIVFNVGEKKLSLRKIVDNLTKFIRNNNLALNFATSVAGYLKGNVDTLIEDQLGEYTTIESKNWARLEYTKNLTDVLSQIGSKKQTNKMHLLLRRNRVVEINSILTNTERAKLTSSVLNSEMLYLNYKTGDYGLKGRVALAVYHNTRLVDGKFLDKAEFRRIRRTEGKDEKAINSEWKSLEEKNLYNAFEVVDAQLVVKKEFEQYVTEGLENKVQGRIEYTANTIDGTMSETDKGALSREIGGAFLLMHRGWLINMLDSRFKGNTVDLVTGKEEMGYYPAALQYFNEGRKEVGLKNIMSLLGGSYWKKMKTESPGKTKGVKKAALDFLYLNILGFLAALVNVAADADDDEEDFTLQFSAYILNRTLLEHTSGNPVLNYSEMLQIVDEPVVGVRMMKDLLDIGEIFNFGETYESGMYEGRSHGAKWWMKKWPGKNLYELQFPEMKNRFIKTQVLNSGFYELMKEDDGDEDEGGGLFNRFKALLMSDSDILPTEAYNSLNEDYDDSK